MRILPPASGRQFFALSAPAGKLLLTVTNDPGTLRWLGTSATWDGTTANWANTISGVNPDTFRTGDAVVFEQQRGQFVLHDSSGETRTGAQKLLPTTVIRAGAIYEANG